MEAWLEGLRAAGSGEVAGAGGLVIAVVSVLLTLVELCQIHRQLRLEALIRIMDANREIVALGFGHPALWQVMDGQALEDTRMQRRWLQLWMNHMQVLWTAWRQGLVARGEWEAYQADMAAFLQSRLLREHWATVARFYPRGFRRLVERLLCEEG
jgi:hypothetical protein